MSGYLPLCRKKYKPSSIQQEKCYGSPVMSFHNAFLMVESMTYFTDLLLMKSKFRSNVQNDVKVSELATTPMK